MATIIKDGAGNGYTARVNRNNRVETRAITSSDSAYANQIGDGYNINTGPINLTSANASACLYFLNAESPKNGEAGIHVDALAVGVQAAAATTYDLIPEITIISNPTGGTIITPGPTAVDMNANRNFGSSNTLAAASVAYKGAEGDTLTGGVDVAKFYMSGDSRLYAAIDLTLPLGSSIGVTVDPGVTAGSVNVYIALIVRRLQAI